MTFSPLEMFGLASMTYLITTSAQQIFYKYGYARGKEEALRDAKLSAAKEAAR